MEKWEFYKDDIQVSSYGRIKYKGKIKKQYYDKDGYCIVSIKSKQYKVHRLVALTFIDNINNLAEVNHKDMNKKNNNANNLEWCSHLENMKHAFKNKNIGSLRNKKVIQYTLDNKIIKVWDSIKEATELLGIASGNISKCCQNKIKRTGIYKWEYLK